MKVDGYQVFIAYGSHDSALKDAIPSALAEQLDLPTEDAIRDNIYTFSDADSSYDWLRRNTSALAGARVLVVVLTPSSLYSPWIHSEIALNTLAPLPAPSLNSVPHAEGMRPMVIGLAGGLTSSTLPPDIVGFYNTLGFDFIELHTPPGVHKFLRSIGSALEYDRAPSDLAVGSIVEAAQGPLGWEVTSRSVMATGIGLSPFKFTYFVNEPSTRHIIDCGQNLYFLWGDDAKAKDLRICLAKRLNEGPDLRLEVVICNRRYRKFVKSWEHLMQQRAYRRHLRASTKNLTGFWKQHVLSCAYCQAALRDPDKVGAPHIDVFAVNVMPVSLTFINPDDENGLLFIKPQISPEPTNRPVFCVSKLEQAHLAAFSHYLGTLRQLLRLPGFTTKLTLARRRAVFKPATKVSEQVRPSSPPPAVAQDRSN